MWLFPLMMWQKKEILQFVIQVSLISQFANTVFLINGEGWRNGTPFTFLMLLGMWTCLILEKFLKNMSIKQKKNIAR